MISCGCLSLLTESLPRLLDMIPGAKGAYFRKYQEVKQFWTSRHLDWLTFRLLSFANLKTFQDFLGRLFFATFRLLGPFSFVRDLSAY